MADAPSTSAVTFRALGLPPPGWTRVDVRRVRLLYATWPVGRIAQAVGRPPEDLIDLAAHLRLGQWDRKTGWTAAEVRELARLYRRLPAVEIARRLGRTRSSVYGMATRLGLIRGRDGRWEAGRAGARARWAPAARA